MPTSNPNRARITDELWWFWLQFHKLEPHARLGGFYANKTGYHNTRNANPRNDYSVLSVVDRKGAGDKAAAIDLTFPSAQHGDYREIAKYSARLLRSGRDPLDERGNYLRSFYGNADSDRQVEGWDFQRTGSATSDSTHLWHIHISFSRGHVKNLKAMRAVLSILSGESVKAWRLKEAARLLPPPKPRKRTPAPTKPATAPPKNPETTAVTYVAPSPIRPPIVDLPPVEVEEAALALVPGDEPWASLPVPPAAEPTTLRGWRALVARLRDALRGSSNPTTKG